MDSRLPYVGSRERISDDHRRKVEADALRQVIDYLAKKGYAQTEATLRREMTRVDGQGRLVIERTEELGGRKYAAAFTLLVQWIDDNLEVYKAELDRLKWPVFVYSFLSLVGDNFPEMAQDFFAFHKSHFQREHEADLRALEMVKHPEHLDDNETAKIYRHNLYRLTLVETTHFSLLNFLESKERAGGSVIISILQTHMHIVTVDRAATTDRSFASVLSRRGLTESLPEEDEGIPGHNPGSANTDRNAPPVLARLNLGPLPMDAEAAGDVRDELEDADAVDPPLAGQPSLIEELDKQIKRESSEDAPSRDTLPLPKPLARDVAADVQRIKDYRDRYQLPARGSASVGSGPGVSVTMYTFHNTFDSVNCIGFSCDNELIAAGTAESYARVWTMSGDPLPSLDPNATARAASRRLIGHSGPVYDLSFCPNPSPLPSASVNGMQNGAIHNNASAHHLLLTCSADGKIRLWSLATCSTLCIYTGHTHPVWAVRWSPQGHYFASASADRTARLWSTEHVGPLRIFAGHDSDVETLTWHPNGCYLVTAGADRTVRMWDVSKGTSVRMFTGHLGIITSLSMNPFGKVVASADDRGTIILWDLENGRRTKSLRGHGRGGIWSMTWSVEGTLLVSGGADGTVRVWDAVSPSSAADGIGPGLGGQGGNIKTENKDTKKSNVGSVGVAGGAMGGGKKEDPKVSPEQISAFPTRKSPVYTVHFTSMNLVLAAGCYLPGTN
ncbi:MAG: hypothetical protein Q9159_002435 [Coniocarpon cinnabarinum]